MSRFPWQPTTERWQRRPNQHSEITWRRNIPRPSPPSGLKVAPSSPHHRLHGHHTRVRITISACDIQWPRAKGLRPMYAYGRTRTAWTTECCFWHLSTNKHKGPHHTKRAATGSVAKRLINSPERTLPKQWKNYLKNSDNKPILIQFLFDKWTTYTLKPSISCIYVNHGQLCHQLLGVGNVRRVDSLCLDQTEADTIMLLHAVHADVLPWSRWTLKRWGLELGTWMQIRWLGSTV